MTLAPIHESVAITSHGVPIVGDLSYGSRVNELAVVWVHGFGSHRGGDKALSVEAECSRRGWTFAAFDFRGHGRSGGSLLELRPSALLEDLEVIENYLVERGVRRLALVGSSMGGFASAWFATRSERVKAVVLIAPAFRFAESRWGQLTAEQQEQWRTTGRLRVVNDWLDVEVGYGVVEERELFRMAALANQWNKPMRIEHGMRDDIVPFGVSVAFAEATPYPDVELRLWRDGDHRLTAQKDAIARGVGEWLAVKAE